MFWISKLIHYLNRFRRRLIVFFAVLGPGIMVMVADNDAGGISTYAVTGSKFGHEDLGDIGFEPVAIDWTVQHHRRNHS